MLLFSFQWISLLYWVGQKIHLGFSVGGHGKNPNELFGQTNISFVCCNLSDVMGRGQTGEGSSSPVLVFSLQP